MRVKNFILGLIVTAVLNGIPQPFPGRVLPVYDSLRKMTAMDTEKIADAIFGVKPAYAGPGGNNPPGGPGGGQQGQGGNGGNQQQLATLQAELQTKLARKAQLRGMMMSGDPAFNQFADEYAALNDSIPNLQAQIAALQNSNGNSSGNSGGGTLTVSTGATSATISSGGSAPFTCAQAGTFPVQIINQGPNGYTRSTTVNVVCTQCGNGVVEPGEVCDDGMPAILPDGSMVSQNSCGNNLLSCDTNGAFACKRCMAASCTNGIRQWSDGACDTLGGPPCINPNQICQVVDGIGIECACVDVPRCGDGIVNGTDQCDTANNAADQCPNGFACDAPNCMCKSNCGNGKIDMNVNGVNEGCDPVPGIPPNPECPGGQVCYDPAGGMLPPPGGGISQCTCVAEYCGDRKKTGAEQCDLGPGNECPGNAKCKKIDCTCAECGNNIIETGEECDGAAEPPAGPLDTANGEVCQQCKRKKVCPPLLSRCYLSMAADGIYETPSGHTVNSSGQFMWKNPDTNQWELSLDNQGNPNNPAVPQLAQPNDGLAVGAVCTAQWDTADGATCRYKNGVCAYTHTDTDGVCKINDTIGFNGLMCQVVTCSADVTEISVDDIDDDLDAAACQQDCDNRCSNGQIDVFEECDNGPNPNNNAALKCTNPAKVCNAQCKCVNPPPPAENLGVNPGGNVIRGFANA